MGEGVVCCELKASYGKDKKKIVEKIESYWNFKKIERKLELKKIERKLRKIVIIINVQSL